MRTLLIWALFALAGWVAGCAGSSATKPVELLDERTGITVAALAEPIELVPGVQTPAIVSRKRLSFAYVGPVEWNRSGALSYGLWVHIAPGIDPQPDDIRAAGTLTLRLQDAAVILTPIEAPRLGREPYRQVVPWGQTAYFALTVEELKRLAASPTLALDVRATDGTVINFAPAQSERDVLARYLKDRGITVD
ncbi:MAG: hypothetical protein NVS9B2_25580 [Steroidobacteraceae bacterium]